VAAGKSETESAATLSPEVLGVVTPDVPGDISLAGILSEEVVAELASRYRGWLYLNEPDHPNFFKAKIEGAGCSTRVVPVPSPKSGGAATTLTADAVLKAMGELPRPLMLQCTSGNRSGAALLLWLAKQQGHNAQSAMQLARDMNLQFFTDCSECSPIVDWVMGQLEPAGTPAAAPAPQGAGFVVKQLFDTQGSSTFTYFVGCSASREAVLIDPVLGMQERDLALADELGFTIKYVVNTHCHADHVTSGAAIKKLRPDVKTIIAEAAGAKADIKVRDGHKIEFGKYALDCRSTPGHTDGCMTFVLEGPDEPRAAFTGDALLIRGCGRTDFQAGNSELLYDSVHQRILSLPGDTKVYPGHDYQGRNLSTVDEERQFNPRLTKSKAEFAQIMANLNLPKPALIETALPWNLLDGEQP